MIDLGICIYFNKILVLNVSFFTISIMIFLPPPQHLKSAKHLEYAHDDENFASLDKVIAKGTKFDDFVASVRARYPRRCKTPPR